MKWLILVSTATGIAVGVLVGMSGDAWPWVVSAALLGFVGGMAGILAGQASRGTP